MIEEWLALPCCWQSHVIEESLAFPSYRPSHVSVEMLAHSSSRSGLVTEAWLYVSSSSRSSFETEEGLTPRSISVYLSPGSGDRYTSDHRRQGSVGQRTARQIITLSLPDTRLMNDANLIDVHGRPWCKSDIYLLGQQRLPPHAYKRTPLDSYPTERVKVFRRWSHALGIKKMLEYRAWKTDFNISSVPWRFVSKDPHIVWCSPDL